MKKQTLLTILQQSEYDYRFFSLWYDKHHDENIILTPSKWTQKLQLMSVLLSLFFFLPETMAIKLSLGIAGLIEFPIKSVIFFAASLKLWWLKHNGLKVIAITGSYAKTSTKHSMLHLLSGELPVLATPKSVNTPLGISQIILHQLNDKHKLFIVELGEYYIGDIAKLTAFVKPDYGVITPIGRQHLERMGSIENIAATFAELLQYFKHKLNHVIVASSNREYYQKYDLVYYGRNNNDDYAIENATISKQGTEFSVKLPAGVTKKAFSPLYGEHQAVNVLPSLWLSQKLGLDSEKIIKRIATLPYVERRHQPTFLQNDVLLLDNSYNTNPDSIDASLSLVDQLHPSRSFIVTMGFTELGEASAKVHAELGKKLAKQIDFVALAESPNSENIKQGFLEAGGNDNHIVIGKTLDEAFTMIQDKLIPGSIVLFEGGWQEVYL